MGVGTHSLVTGLEVEKPDYLLTFSKRNNCAVIRLSFIPRLERRSQDSGHDLTRVKLGAVSAFCGPDNESPSEFPVSQ